MRWHSPFWTTQNQLTEKCEFYETFNKSNQISKTKYCGSQKMITKNGFACKNASIIFYVTINFINRIGSMESRLALAEWPTFSIWNSHELWFSVSVVHIFVDQPKTELEYNGKSRSPALHTNCTNINNLSGRDNANVSRVSVTVRHQIVLCVDDNESEKRKRRKRKCTSHSTWISIWRDAKSQKWGGKCETLPYSNVQRKQAPVNAIS